MVVVDVVGDHEVESVLLVGRSVLVDAQVEIGDHAGSFHGVHESRSVSVVLVEDLSGEEPGALLVESPFSSSVSDPADWSDHTWCGLDEWSLGLSVWGWGEG